MAQIPEASLLTHPVSERDHLDFLHKNLPNFINNQGFKFTWVEDLRSAHITSPGKSIGPWDPNTLDKVTFLLTIETVKEKRTLRYRFYLDHIVKIEQTTPYEPDWHTIPIKKLDPKDNTPAKLQDEILEKLRQEFVPSPL